MRCAFGIRLSLYFHAMLELDYLVLIAYYLAISSAFFEFTPCLTTVFYQYFRWLYFAVFLLFVSVGLGMTYAKADLSVDNPFRLIESRMIYAKIWHESGQIHPQKSLWKTHARVDRTVHQCSMARNLQMIHARIVISLDVSSPAYLEIMAKLANGSREGLALAPLSLCYTYSIFYLCCHGPRRCVIYGVRYAVVFLWHFCSMFDVVTDDVCLFYLSNLLSMPVDESCWIRSCLLWCWCRRMLPRCLFVLRCRLCLWWT